ncbi:hypothetical protein [Pelatocladus sp. BLCC-F211]|uniref:hypothetical protein n=1 Tax=Pelatocladus sp. BLCC-F211 TaxID=3342752 RepID=UPI0035BC57BF
MIRHPILDFGLLCRVDRECLLARLSLTRLPKVAALRASMDFGFSIYSTDFPRKNSSFRWVYSQLHRVCIYVQWRSQP